MGACYSRVPIECGEMKGCIVVAVQTVNVEGPPSQTETVEQHHLTHRVAQHLDTQYNIT